jgi:branched-chain amino acid aminotransferase
MSASGRVVYQNGEFVAESDARISIFDSALMFGDMVFEMTRSFNKEQFRLQDHLERLMAGVKILHIPLTIGVEELVEICHEVVRRNDPVFSATDEHRLMINVSRGPLGIYGEIFDNKFEPTVVVADFPLKWTVAGMGELFDVGINAVVPSQRAIPSSLMDPKIKNRSRLFYQMANIEVSKVKGDRNWALLLDPEGLVTEGTGDNFFIVRDGVVITPEGRNVLRGISRDYIFELCVELGIECIEKPFDLYDVYTADEAFMTGTPFCLLPVSSLNDLPIGTEPMGPVTRGLLNRWSENVGLNIENQIKDFNKETTESAGTSPYRFKK